MAPEILLSILVYTSLHFPLKDSATGPFPRDAVQKWINANIYCQFYFFAFNQNLSILQVINLHILLGVVMERQESIGSHSISRRSATPIQTIGIQWGAQHHSNHQLDGSLSKMIFNNSHLNIVEHCLTSITYPQNSDEMELLSQRSKMEGIFNYSLLKGISNSCLQLKILSDTSKRLRFYLERDDGQFELLSQIQVKGIPHNKLLRKEVWNQFFIKLIHEDGRPKIQFCGKLRGGSKIPVVDEIFRSFGSLGDVMTGNPEHARKRWQNWTEDSAISNYGKTIGYTAASGATAMVGKKDSAKYYINKAGDSGQKLGAIYLSSASQAGGIAMQGMTGGMPTPLSGALNESAAHMNQVIDKNAREGKYGIDWDQFGYETGIGIARGGASNGGLIPYAGNAVERSIRGEKMEFDHGQEWAQWGINMGTTAITAGTARGVGKLSSMGKIGLKSAIGVGFAVGTVTGVGSGYLSQKLHTSKLQDRLIDQGYEFDRNEKKDGQIFAIYIHPDMEDAIVPCPNLGDAIGNGLLEGLIGALASCRAYKKNRPNGQFYGQIDRHATQQKQGRTFTADEVEMEAESLRRWEVQSTNDLTEAMTASSKWIRVQSEENVGMQMIYKYNKGKQCIDVAFLEHASGRHTYGPFNFMNVDKFVNMIDKMKTKAHERGGLDVRSIYLLGCEVTPEFKKYMKTKLGTPVRTLPHVPNSRLEIAPGTREFRYYQVTQNGNHRTIFKDHLKNIEEYLE